METITLKDLKKDFTQIAKIRILQNTQESAIPFAAE